MYQNSVFSLVYILNVKGFHVYIKIDVRLAIQQMAIHI